MFRMTDVVKSLLIINVIVFVLTGFINPELKSLFALHYPAFPSFKPFQLISHFFTHGDLMHILFNMFALVMFGSTIESIWGPKKFLIYYLISAAGSAFLHLAMIFLGFSEPYPAVGASGAIYGLLIAFAVKFPNAELMLLFLPIPIKAKYFVPVLILIDVFLGFSSFNSPIAHFAHLGGAIAGFLTLLSWKEVNGNPYT
ncbi:MAG: rhomboid family intramembrane serine protease [Bacteroidota bacterium]